MFGMGSLTGRLFAFAPKVQDINDPQFYWGVNKMQ